MTAHLRAVFADQTYEPAARKDESMVTGDAMAPAYDPIEQAPQN